MLTTATTKANYVPVVMDGMSRQTTLTKTCMKVSEFWESSGLRWLWPHWSKCQPVTSVYRRMDCSIRCRGWSNIVCIYSSDMLVLFCSRLLWMYLCKSLQMKFAKNAKRYLLTVGAHLNCRPSASWAWNGYTFTHNNQVISPEARRAFT